MEGGSIGSLTKNTKGGERGKVGSEGWSAIPTAGKKRKKGCNLGRERERGKKDEID